MDKVKALSEAMSGQPDWMDGHSIRVMEYAVEIGKAMGLSAKSIETLRMAGLLHDIGKVDTCASVLEKRGGLTSTEFELVKLHPVHGAEILCQSDTLSLVAQVIRHHHERYDGTGYPDGLKDDGIPFLSRILYVADAFDSMTADRPYRKAPGKDYAVSELIRCAGTQFDPGVVWEFLKIAGDFPSGREYSADSLADLAPGLPFKKQKPV